MRTPVIELVAVQSFMRSEDYRDERAFTTKIEALAEQVATARARDTGGGFAHPALVVFPEHIGTFLSIADHTEVLRGDDEVDAVLRRIVTAHPLRFLGSMVSHRTVSPTAAVLLQESAKMHRIYRAAFGAVARRLQATVVAGSIILPENAAGLDAAELRPRGSQLFNLSYTFAPDGRCVNVTKKVNLVPTLEDTLPLTPGDPEALAAIDTPCGRVGVLICYDGFAEPHTHREPGFCVLGPRVDAARVEIIAQPSANSWPWDGPWVFCDPGETQLRREQWLREGLFAQLRDLRGVRYVVNPQMIGTILGSRFEGRSYVFARDADGTPRILAEAARYTLDAGSEEIVVARVPAGIAVAPDARASGE